MDGEFNSLAIGSGWNSSRFQRAALVRIFGRLVHAQRSQWMVLAPLHTYSQGVVASGSIVIFQSIDNDHPNSRENRSITVSIGLITDGRWCNAREEGSGILHTQ